MSVIGDIIYSNIKRTKINRKNRNFENSEEQETSGQYILQGKFGRVLLDLVVSHYGKIDCVYSVLTKRKFG